MAAEWTKLDPERHEECASVSCGHSPASWRMEAGGVGSFFCEMCHGKIVGDVTVSHAVGPFGMPATQIRLNRIVLRD